MLGLLNLNMDTTQLSNVLMWGGVAYLVFMGVRGYLTKDTDATKPGVQLGGFSEILGDVGGLLQHVDSLGLPLLKPLAAAAAGGNVATMPGILKGIFGQLGNKESRSKVLETLFWAQFTRWIEDNDRAKQLIEKLMTVADRLGYTITKKPPSA